MGNQRQHLSGGGFSEHLYYTLQKYPTITMNGIHATLWHLAVHKLENSKHPTAIIVFGGNKSNQAEFATPILYYPDFITKNFRKP